MEPIAKNQLFSLLEGMGRAKQQLLAGENPLSRIIPFSSWDQVNDPSFFEGKTLEQIQNVRMGIIHLKAANPIITRTVQPIITRVDDLIRSGNTTVAARAETVPDSSLPSVIKKPASQSDEEKSIQRTARIKAHIETQMERAGAYAEYQEMVFIPTIEAETNRLIGPDEYLQKGAKFLTGEAFEMVVNHHLVEPEVGAKINGAHEKAVKLGKVFFHNTETALL